MGSVGITGYFRLHESAPHHIANVINQWVMNDAVWDVNNTVGTELKQPQLRRAHAAADSKARAMPKSGAASRNDRHIGEAMNGRQPVQCTARRERNI